MYISYRTQSVRLRSAQPEVRSKCNYYWGNILDVNYNAYYEAERPFVCICVDNRTNLC